MNSKSPELKPAKLNPEQALLEATKGLTRKQREFVRLMSENKKMTAKEAALRSYDITTERSAESIGSSLLRKTEIVSALNKHNELVENTLIGTVKDWGKSRNTRQREVALDAAKFVHDKLHGKATQRVEQQSVSVSIDIDLS